MTTEDKKSSSLYFLDGTEALLSTELPDYPRVHQQTNRVAFVAQEEILDLMDKETQDVLRNRVKNGVAIAVDSPEGKRIRYCPILARYVHYHKEFKTFVCLKTKENPDPICCRTPDIKPSFAKLGTIVVVYNLDGNGEPLLDKTGKMAYTLYQLIFSETLYTTIHTNRKSFPPIKSDLNITCTIKPGPDGKDIKILTAQFQPAPSLWQEDPEVASAIIKKAEPHWNRIVSKLGSIMTEEKFEQILAANSGGGGASKPPVANLSEDATKALESVLVGGFGLD